MTPNTGNFDQAAIAEAMGEVLSELMARTGNKSILMTHSQGGAVGWDVPVENISAIVAIEPGGTPELAPSSTTGCWRRASPSSSTLETILTMARRI